MVDIYKLDVPKSIKQDGETTPLTYNQAIMSYIQRSLASNQTLSTNDSEDNKKCCDCGSEEFRTTFFFVIFMILYFAVCLSLIVMGIMFYHSCAAEDRIPAFLLTGGCFGFLFGIFSSVCFHEDTEPSSQIFGSATGFNIVWLITCSVFVYKTHFQSTDSTKDDYCDYYLYSYAFWFVTSTYALLGLVLLIAVCCIIYSCY